MFSQLTTTSALTALKNIYVRQIHQETQFRCLGWVIYIGRGVKDVVLVSIVIPQLLQFVLVLNRTHYLLPVTLSNRAPMNANVVSFHYWALIHSHDKPRSFFWLLILSHTFLVHLGDLNFLKGLGYWLGVNVALSFVIDYHFILLDLLYSFIHSILFNHRVLCRTQ